MTFKNIRISKRGGGTRLQRVKVLASGKYKFVKNLTKSKSRTTKSKTKTKKRRKTNLARRKKRRGGGKSLQQQVFKWLRIGALVAPGAIALTAEGTTHEKLTYVLAKYTGYEAWNRKFNFGQLIEGYAPFLATTLVTYGIPKIAGIIRRL